MMMNKISRLFIASLVLGAALSACKNSGKSTAPAAGGQDSLQTVAQGAIVFVNMDSLVSNYAMYYDLKAQFEEKSKKVENELNTKGRSFERDMMNYQEQMQKGLITRSQAGQIEEKLKTKQQALVQYREKSLSELAEEEQVLLNRIHYSIMKYLEEFNADHRYGMILSSSNGNPVLNADPRLNITQEVVSGLNAQYKSEKNKPQLEDSKIEVTQ